MGNLPDTSSEGSTSEDPDAVQEGTDVKIPCNEEGEDPEDDETPQVDPLAQVDVEGVPSTSGLGKRDKKRKKSSKSSKKRRDAAAAKLGLRKNPAFVRRAADEVEEKPLPGPVTPRIKLTKRTKVGYEFVFKYLLQGRS